MIISPSTFGATLRGTLSLAEQGAVQVILDQHGLDNETRDKLVSMCLECGSVVVAASSGDHEIVAANFDTNCCGDEALVVFRRIRD